MKQSLEENYIAHHRRHEEAQKERIVDIDMAFNNSAFMSVTFDLKCTSGAFIGSITYVLYEKSESVQYHNLCKWAPNRVSYYMWTDV